jgi:hypothetical protein
VKWVSLIKVTNFEHSQRGENKAKEEEKELDYSRLRTMPIFCLILTISIAFLEIFLFPLDSFVGYSENLRHLMHFVDEHT